MYWVKKSNTVLILQSEKLSYMDDWMWINIDMYLSIIQLSSQVKVAIIV